MKLGILFDLFGTIVVPFSQSRHSHVLSLASQTLGLDAARCNAAWNADYENRIRGLSGRIATQLSAIARSEGIELSQDELEPIVRSYGTFCDKLLTPVPTATRTLRALLQRRIPIGLVSNTAPDFAAAFERSPLRPFFKTCTFSCAIGVPKPDPAIYTAACQELGLDPADVLFVGDGSDDELAGALRAGLTPALVEADTSDTYDAIRHGVRTWSGLRLRDLSDVLALIPTNCSGVARDER